MANKPERTGPRTTVLRLFVFGGMLAVFGLGVLYARASLVVEGTITQSVTTCDDASNRTRCLSTYQVTSAVDGMVRELTAGPNDIDIQQRLPVGTTLLKYRWQLDYNVNGVPVDDFPSDFYILLSGIGIGSITLGAVMVHHQASRSAR